MKGFNLDGTPYTTENVQWVMYFNGGQAFHGVYWHTNWGNRMSHGCVGMPISRAKQIYDWSASGTDVWIHN
jgi:lipoprotein-anchoring transpeptidase ErfK/SrfK